MKKMVLFTAILLSFVTTSAQNTSYVDNSTPINGTYNVAFGKDAGVSNNKKENVFVGFASGGKNDGSGNVFVGSKSGENNDRGSGNVFIGGNSGFENRGSGNVFIGGRSGMEAYESNNLLYIENSESNKPLIWGDFNKDVLNFNSVVGINNESPTSALNIGNATIRTDNYIVLGRRKNTLNELSDQLPYLGQDSYDGKTNDLSLATGKSGAINFYTDTESGTFEGSIKMRITGDGKVGIGINSPNEKLSVNGKIDSKEVRVHTDNWPDYVFEDDYNLKPIQTVEKYIIQNGHLPNIPNAEEVIKNGILLGDMNSKLLEKIEELTLYTIQQQKEIESQRKINESLQARLERLESLVQSKK